MSKRSYSMMILINDEHVKVRLREDQSLYYYQGGPTDEGWFSYTIDLSFYDGFVYMEVNDDGADCDGPLYRNYQMRCHWTQLQAIPLSYEKDFSQETVTVMIPDWQELDSSQRDVFAESMGY